MSGTESLRAGVIGVGYLGRFHAQKYKVLSEKSEFNLKFVGVCDLNAAQADQVAQELGVKAFYRIEELAQEVDVVTIATSTPRHYELTQFFLNQGKHVLVEKPIALKCFEAEEVVRMAKLRGLVLAVGHSERFNPAYRYVKPKIQRARFVEFTRLAPFNSRGSEVSVIHDLMIHDLDLMLSLNQTKPRLLAASAGKVVTETFDWAEAMFEFESGMKAILHSSRISSSMIRSMRVLEKDHQWVVNLQTGDVERAYVQETSSTKAMAHEVYAAGRGDNLLTETEDFVRAIQGRGTLTVSGDDGWKALELAEQVITMIASQRGY